MSGSAPPTIAPGGIMRRIRGRSSAELFGEFPRLKERYRGRHFWGRGYFCASVGQVADEMIRSYPEHHSEPNPDDEVKEGYKKTGLIRPKRKKVACQKRPLAFSTKRRLFNFSIIFKQFL